MTDWAGQPNYNNDIPAEAATLQKHSTGLTHVKEVLSGTNIVKIVTAALADLCVTTEKLAALAVTTAKIAAAAVTPEKLDRAYSTTDHTHAADTHALDDLTDVAVPSPTVGDSLVYSHGTQLSAPTAPTVADGGAGALTGTFTYKVTFTDEFGETTPSVASASTGALTNRQVTVTIPTGVGASGRKLYRSSGGAYALCATVAENTTTEVTDNNVSPSGSIPTENTTGELLWRDETATALTPGTAGQQLRTNDSGVVAWSDDDEGWNFGFGDGSADIAAATEQKIQIHDNYEIQEWSISPPADSSGSIELDVLISEAGPTGSNADWYKVFTSIVASAPPAITGTDYAEDSTLTGWSKTLAAGRWIKVSVTSCTGVTNATFVLKVRRTD